MTPAGGGKSRGKNVNRPSKMTNFETNLVCIEILFTSSMSRSIRLWDSKQVRLVFSNL